VCAATVAAKSFAANAKEHVMTEKNKAKSKIAGGVVKVANGIATACGYGILSFITKNHRITPAARLIGQRSVQSGLKQIKEGRQALKNAK
jgi:hypothetical protein